MINLSLAQTIKEFTVIINKDIYKLVYGNSVTNMVEEAQSAASRLSKEKNPEEYLLDAKTYLKQLNAFYRGLVSTNAQLNRNYDITFQTYHHLCEVESLKEAIEAQLSQEEELCIM